MFLSFQVKDQISELTDINSDLAIRLLLENEDSVPASTVMAKIANQPKLQVFSLAGCLGCVRKVVVYVFMVVMVRKYR